jgi:hypothetical protein
VAVLAVFSFWFYNSGPSNFKNKVASVVPYPAAIIDGRPIYIKDLLKHNNINELISEKQTAIVADKFGVTVSGDQLNSQFGQIKGQADFSSLLLQYSLSESDFKNNVLKPQLLYTNLRLWFNGQRSLNPNEYALADIIKSQISGANGASSTFASLVSKYSKDDSTKKMEGNLGFVEVNNLWPEFQAAFDSLKSGDVQTVAGRDGLYIFQIRNKDNNGPNNSPRVEIGEIYLKMANFDTWYNNEIKNINIKKLI